MEVIKSVYLVVAQVVFWLIVNHVVLSAAELIMSHDEYDELNKPFLAQFVFHIMAEIVGFLTIIPLLIDALAYRIFGSLLEKTIFDKDIIQERKKNDLLVEQGTKILELEKETLKLKEMIKELNKEEISQTGDSGRTQKSGPAGKTKKNTSHEPHFQVVLENGEVVGATEEMLNRIADKGRTPLQSEEMDKQKERVMGALYKRFEEISEKYEKKSGE